jgi:hypothetical protein
MVRLRVRASHCSWWLAFVSASLAGTGCSDAPSARPSAQDASTEVVADAATSADAGLDAPPGTAAEAGLEGGFDVATDGALVPDAAPDALVAPDGGSRSYPPETDLAQHPQNDVAEPALLQTVTNSFVSLGPQFDTLTIRASDSRHHYSKDSPWNSDESLVMTNDGQILDGHSYAFLRKVPFPSEHKTWSNTDPRYIYGASKSARQWLRLDATTGTSTVVATYDTYSSVSYGAYEGNLDDADSGAALIGNGNTPFLIDPKTGAVRCVVSSGGGFGHEVSDSTMSHDGQWMLVHWAGYGVDAYRAVDCSFAHQLTTATSHYDACVSQAGEQVYVSEGAKMIRLSDAKLLGQQWVDGSRAHVSCRNIRRPGWIYVSTENGTCDDTLKSMKKFHLIFAAKLDGSQRVQNFAFDHQPCPSTYDIMPMVAPSPWGDRVWWKANWDGTSALHSFVSWKP